MTATRIVRLAALGLLVVTVGAPAPAGDPPARTREQELVALLRSETPEADKALAFKNLAIHGSAACVGDVATYLGNERLASWARITLEAVPGAEASAALRTATERLSGRLLVGVINSLGVRRDAAAVTLLVTRLGDADPAVATAAAAALGKIGTAEAAAGLARALAAGKPDRDSVAEACVVCAERLTAAGDAATARTLIDAVRQADVPEQRRAEATRAAIILRGRDGLPLLAELLRSPSRRLFNMGLFTARELAAGPPRDAALAYEVDLALLKAVAEAGRDAANADRAALLVTLLGDRNVGGAGTAVQQALLEAAAAGAPEVRRAAIVALGRCGDAAAAARLLEIAAGADPAVVAGVRQALASSPAAGVDDRITGRLASADAAVLPLVIQLVGDRRIVAATDAILPLADHADAAVRQAAVAALGSLVDLDRVDVLVRRAVSPRDDAEATAAAAALREAAVRMADREACAARIAGALATAGGRAGVLVDTLAEVGGTKALETVVAAAKSGDAALQDAATRVLGKWMTADAAPLLLELATNEAVGSYRGRAMKGYLRIARQFALSEAERAEMCRKVLAVAADAADKKAAVEILVRHPHASTLAVAREAAAMPDVRDEAQAAVKTIEAKIGKPAGMK